MFFADQSMKTKIKSVLKALKDLNTLSDFFYSCFKFRLLNIKMFFLFWKVLLHSKLAKHLSIKNLSKLVILLFPKKILVSIKRQFMIWKAETY